MVLLTKHFKIKSLLATLVLSTLPPPPEATAFKHGLGQTDLSGHSVLKPLQTQFPKPGIGTYTQTPNKLCQNCKIFHGNKTNDQEPSWKYGLVKNNKLCQKNIVSYVQQEYYVAVIQT